jgi:hypothetical protein
MKTSLAILSALTFVVAQPDAARAQLSPSPTTVAYIDALLDAAVEDLRVDLAENGGTREQFNRLRGLLEARAEAALQDARHSCNVQFRLEQAIDELTARFEQAVIEYEDANGFHEDLYDARIDEAVGTLMQMAPRRLAQPGAFDALVSNLEARAAVVSTGPEGPHFEARLASIVRDMEQAAQQYMLTFDHWARFYDALIDARLESALNRLQRRLAGSGGTRADYRRVSRQMEARAEVARGILPDPCE